MSTELRVGSRLGRQTATFIEQVRGQHNTRQDGQQIVVDRCVWIPEGTPTETQGERATTEARSTLYVPRTLPDVSSWLCTVQPGPVDADGEPLRMAVVGPAQPYWRRKRTFSHSQVALRSTIA